MKFNYEKFLQETNQSSAYKDWSRHLIETLNEAGDSHPYRDYSYSPYTFTIRTEIGRRRRPLVNYIFCYNDGRIEVEPDEKMKPNEITSVCKQVIHFFAVMQSAGYIID